MILFVVSKFNEWSIADEFGNAFCRLPLFLLSVGCFKVLFSRFRLLTLNPTNSLGFVKYENYLFNTCQNKLMLL